MKNYVKFYDAIITVYSKDSLNTAVKGERCVLEKAVILDRKPYFVIINNVKNEMIIPCDVFDDFFYTKQRPKF